MKKIAIELAEEAYVLADKSKFTETFFAKVANVEQATIITSNVEQSLVQQYVEITNMKVVTP